MKVKTICFTPPVQPDKRADQVGILVFYMAIPLMVLWSMIGERIGGAVASLGQRQPSVASDPKDNVNRYASTCQTIVSVAAPEPLSSCGQQEG